MKLLKAAATAAMLAVMVGTSLVGTSTSASASNPQPMDLRHCYDQPDQTLFCFWSQSLYNGTMGLIDPVASGRCVDLTANGGFAGWSYYNHSGRAQRVWSNGNCTGSNRLISNGSSDPYPPFPVRGLGGR